MNKINKTVLALGAAYFVSFIGMISGVSIILFFVVCLIFIVTFILFFVSLFLEENKEIKGAIKSILINGSVLVLMIISIVVLFGQIKIKM